MPTRYLPARAPRRGKACYSIEIQRVLVWLTLIGVGTLHGLSEFLLQQPLAVLHRGHLLREDLLAMFLLLAEVTF